MNSKLTLNDEELLLLELCRLELSDIRLIKIRSLIPCINDWVRFSLMANTHGVAALVWHNIEKYNLQKGIPENVTGNLRGALMKSMSRNIFNTESVVAAIRVLNDEKIKTVLLKGMALEISIYGDTGLRQMSDVDILIAKGDCIKARRILMQNGYVSLPVKSIFHEFIIMHIGKHLPSLIKNGASLEIHHELFGAKNNVMTRMLYDSSYEIEIKGVRAYIPQPQIFFLYLVKHLYLHELQNESQLRLYTDLVVMVEKYKDEIINQDLLKLSLQADMQVILAQRLQPLCDLWGIRFPEFIDEFIDKRCNDESMNKFLFFLKSPKENPTPDNSGFYNHIISDIPGFHRKVLYILGDLFPAISFMKRRYGIKSTWKVLLCYPHRIGKLWWVVKRR